MSAALRVDMMEFTPFRLDTVNQCLWRRKNAENDERVSLPPKTYAVLKHLVEHAGQLVTQNELLEALWPDTFVQPEVLKSHILDIRSRLGDSAKNSRFIETLPRRGYRFIAPVNDPTAEAKLTPEIPSGKLVGRNSALAELRKYLGRSLQDHREILFVTGELGIGKTTLADEFLRRTAADLPSARVARGQCVEGYGGKEAYYPMLEALSQLCGGSGGDTVVKTLAAQAPTWLVQFPALVKREQRGTLQREILGATRERMLREISEALETITSERPLLLVLEDLHWADPSTVDLISALARRRAPGKLMLIGTYRPVDVTLAGHPLKAVKQDLLLHQLCHEIALEPLGEAEVSEYLGFEAEGGAVPEGLSELIYQRTEGNPLFMVAALDHMRNRGLIAVENGAWRVKVPLENVDLAAPESLRQLIELQIERLSAEEQRILEIASVRRFPLSVTVGSAVANIEPDTIEELLEGLARRHQVVRPAGLRDYKTGPSLSYEFVHVLYRDVLYGRIGPARRRRLHQSVAENVEALGVLGQAEVAAELAYQFEEGGDWPRAVKYLISEANTAGRRFEPRQAATILEHALELVNKIPEAERAQSEIEVLQKLATIYATSFDPRALHTYEALAERAAQCGLADVELRALLEMAFPLALVSVDLYMRALERAREALSRSGDGDTLKQAAMRALYLGRRISAGKWDPGDLEECKNIVLKLREAGNRRLLGEVQFGIAYALLDSSEYHEASRSANEGFAILLGDYEENPYLSWTFQVYGNLVCRCLLYLGDWGEALRRINQRVEMVEKNGDRQGATFARMEVTWLTLEAMAFTRAQQLLESAFPVFAPIPMFLRHWLLWAGSAEAGLGNHDLALEYLLKCRDEMDQRPLMADWFMRMPLQRALTEAWFSTGELRNARVEAEQFLKVTQVNKERAFQALAFEVNARLAIAEQTLDRAQDFIAKALQSMEGFEVPLAHWRVHGTAAELHRRLGNRELADQHRELSRATILKLANSLASDEPLRRTFLSAPIVRKILDDGEGPRLRDKKLTPAH
jgi:DNA-binding winged helix-turn-helix (wHTH) protein